MGNRGSSLPIAAFCARAPALSQQGASRAAAVSSCFHALAADDAKGKDMFARLTDEEQAEVLLWKRPTDTVFGGLESERIDLRYADAFKEVEIGLDANGEWCDPASPDCVCVGHADFYWLIEHNGQKVLIVGDLKRSEWTTPDGPRSLQLMAYMLALASKHGAETGLACLWHLNEAQWHFGELIDLGPFSEEADKIKARVVAAAMHTEGDYSMGTHCGGCYGRLHCPAYLMPPEMAETSLAPFVEPGALAAMSSDERGELRMKIERAKKTIEAAEKALKAAAEQGHKVTCGDKEWRAVEMSGRKGYDTARLENEMPEVAAKYAKVGAGYSMMKWTKRT